MSLRGVLLLLALAAPGALSEPSPLAGFVNVTPALLVAAGVDSAWLSALPEQLACPVPDACLAGGGCATGYGGPLCADCLGGRLRHPITRACMDGLPAGMGQGMLFCLLVSAALLLGVAPAACGACGGGAGPRTRQLEHFGAIYAVLLSFLQMGGALSGAAPGFGGWGSAAGAAAPPPLPEWVQFVDARTWSWWGRSPGQFFPFLYVMAFLPAMLVFVDACAAVARGSGALGRLGCGGGGGGSGGARAGRSGPFSVAPPFTLPAGAAGAAATAAGVVGEGTAAGVAGVPLEPTACWAHVGPWFRYVPSFPARMGLLLVTPASLYTISWTLGHASFSNLGYLIAEPSLFWNVGGTGALAGGLFSIRVAWLCVFFAAVCVAPGWGEAASVAAPSPRAAWGAAGARSAFEALARALRAWAANLGAHVWLPAPLFRTVFMVMLPQLPYSRGVAESVALCAGLQAAFLCVAAARARELRYKTTAERVGAWLHVADAFSMAATLAACLSVLVGGPPVPIIGPPSSLAIITYVLTACFFAVLLGALACALLPDWQPPPAVDPVALLVRAAAAAAPLSAAAHGGGGPMALGAGAGAAREGGLETDEKGEGVASEPLAPRPFLPPPPASSACASCSCASFFTCGGGGGGGGSFGNRSGRDPLRRQRPPPTGGLMQFFSSRRPSAAQMSGRPLNAMRLPARPLGGGGSSAWAHANPMTSGGGFPPRR